MKKYFLCANTSSGEANLIYDNLKGITNITIIEGKSKRAKSMLIEKLADIFEDGGNAVEGIMSPYDVGLMDGIIIRENKTAFFDQSCARELEGERVSINDYLKKDVGISAEEEELLRQKEKWAYENLYKTYGDAKVIHDLWEKIYVENMDWNRLNRYTDNVVSRLIPEKKGIYGGMRSTGFFGASTMDGSVNYIEGLTYDLKNRYFIKGRPGTGKSTFLKKLASEAEKKGYDTQVYYCSFDKSSLDMVIVRDLSFAVFDSTPPHEMYPKRCGDEILDFYMESGLYGTDERFAVELEDISKRYALKIKQGLAYLRLGNSFRTELEFYFERGMDVDGILAHADEMVRKIDC